MLLEFSSPTSFTVNKYQLQMTTHASIIERFGCEDCSDPRKATPKWESLKEVLIENPDIAKEQCGQNGIYYPLNLAICIEANPVPVDIIEQLIEIFPEALTDESFQLACANPFFYTDALDVILKYKDDILSHWNLRKIASYDRKDFAHYIIAFYPHALPTCAGEWSLIFGRSTQTFWLQAMLQCRSHLVSEEKVIELNLLHYFTSQSNIDAVQILVEQYPSTLSIRTCGKLPLHEALSNYGGRSYGWNPELVSILLQRGHLSGLEFGGLFENDCDGMSALERSIEMIRNVSFSQELMFGEKWDCLMICIHFLHHFTAGADPEDNIIEIALGTIPFAVDILDLIVSRYANDLKTKPNKNYIRLATDSISRPLTKSIVNKNSKIVNKLFQNISDGKYGGNGREFATQRDENNRLPFHNALNKGLGWRSGISTILASNIMALEETDSQNGLSPFMTTVIGEFCDLDTCFELLKRDLVPILNCEQDA